MGTIVHGSLGHHLLPTLLLPILQRIHQHTPLRILQRIHQPTPLLPILLTLLLVVIGIGEG